MKIKGILTERQYKNFRSFQLVYEWEDSISAQLKLPIYKSKNIFHLLIRNINRIKVGWLLLLLDALRHPKNYYLYFDMEATSYLRLPCIKNIIPVYIDFWLSESELQNFYKIHANSKLILISSKEVIEVLKKDNCRLPIVHFPLSLPDRYICECTIKSKKKIDFVFAGRRDPIFFSYVKLYEKENPDIEYLYQVLENDEAFYVSNKRGRLSEDYNSRQGYNQLLKNSKVAFYSTPGNDPAKEGANGYNQVTPRFLELISNGCLVMSRYKESPDVDFYRLQQLSFRVNSYEDFKEYILLFLDENFVTSHINKYYSYLISHSTSSRAALLQKIFNDNRFN